MGKQAPEAPDPVETAKAQSKYNIETATKTKDLNAHNVYNPYGSSTWQRDENGRPISQTFTLNENAQKQFDAQQNMAVTMANKANDLSKFIPSDKFSMNGLPKAGNNINASNMGMVDGAKSYNNFRTKANAPVNIGNTDNIAQTQFNKNMSMMRPEFDRQKNAQNVQLSERGIPLGSEISNNERNRLNTNQNEAINRTGWDALLNAGNEQSRRAALDMQNSSQNFDQNYKSNAMAAQLQGKEFSEGMARTGFNNNAMAQQFGQNMAIEARQDQIRSNALADRLRERSQSFNELNAYTKGQPIINMPQGAGGQGVNVAGVDYSGLVNNKYNAEMQQYQNDVNGFWSGVTGIASMFI